MNCVILLVAHPIERLRAYKNGCDIDIPSKNETLMHVIIGAGEWHGMKGILRYFGIKE